MNDSGKAVYVVSALNQDSSLESADFAFNDLSKAIEWCKSSLPYEGISKAFKPYVSDTTESFHDAYVGLKHEDKTRAEYFYYIKCVSLL